VPPRVQELDSLCTGPEASKGAFLQQAAALEDAVLSAMLPAFRYLKSLGLDLWNESGLTLMPVSQPGYMTLSSNALAQLHVLEGLFTPCVLQSCMLMSCSALALLHSVPPLFMYLERWVCRARVMPLYPFCLATSKE
jgi:hypothetical protein